MEAHRTLGSGGPESWIKRVVVAVDGSPASVQGLEQVADSRLGSGPGCLSSMFDTCP